MSVTFRIGYCVNCGEQAWVRTHDGFLLGAVPGTKLFYIVLSDDAGHECRVGTLMCCAKCDPETLNIEDLKKVLFSDPEKSGVTGSEPEWSMPHARIEKIKEFTVEV